jgi:predicted methyltransferase
VTFFGDVQLVWSDIEKIAVSKNACFAVAEGGTWPVQSFSAITNRFCSLMPTALAPTLLVGGFPMHRIKDTDPYHDTLNKMQAVRPVAGQVLDTATGLGYTAIEASKTAAHVLTVEFDPAVLEVARLNPWSQQLFDNAGITQRMGDIVDIVPTLEDGSFSRIIHDPPTVSLAGELYSLAFYRHLFRLLSRRGRLFHYLGNPSSGHGARVTKGAGRRLREAGFARVRPCPEAFGVVAYKR